MTCPWIEVGARRWCARPYDDGGCGAYEMRRGDRWVRVAADRDFRAALGYRGPVACDDQLELRQEEPPRAPVPVIAEGSGGAGSVCGPTGKKPGRPLRRL